MDDGWNEWREYVLGELKRLNKCYENIDKKLDRLTVDITTLKVKSGVWGAIGGAIPVAVALGIWLLKK